MDSARMTSRMGLVSSYNEENHAVKLKLMPEGVETGWIPLGSQHIGNGFGIAIGPEIDDQMEIAFQEGDLENPRVIARHFSDKDKPPKVKSGEIMIRSKKGTKLFIDKDGAMTVETPEGDHTVTNGKKYSLTAKDDVSIKSDKKIYIG